MNIHIITCLFNPARSVQIVRNFQTFQAALGALPITVVELALDDDPFVTTSPTSIRIRGTRKDHSLWQKERLLNLALQSLPAEVNAVAWLDADVLLPRSWYHDTCTALKTSPVVQLFRLAHCQGADGAIEQSHLSYGQWAKTQRAGTSGHPGFAWAARRNILPSGLFDACLTGSGDAFMADAFFQANGLDWLTKQVPSWLVSKYETWSQQISTQLDGPATCLTTDLIHLYHGSRANRGYHTRPTFMASANLQAAEVQLDRQGLYTTSNASFRQMMTDYFPSRGDD